MAFKALITEGRVARAGTISPPGPQGRRGAVKQHHKNLGSLEGSQSEVAQIVGSLRKGKITEALPAIRKVSQNAKLTAEQKELLTSVAEKLAPGASKVSGALGEMKGIPGLGK
jgi:hypothetical protein